MHKIIATLLSIQDRVGQIIDSTNESFFEQLVDWWKRMLDYYTSIRSPQLIPNEWEIYDIDLWVGVGSELQKTRPCIIVSKNWFNKWDTVMIIPITSHKPHKKIWIVSVFISQELSNGLDNDSLIMIAKMREVSKSRIRSKRWIIAGKEYKKLKQWLQVYLWI